MNKHLIIGVHLTDRMDQATDVQQLFTDYGCHIKSRIGLHEVENVCAPTGVILLEMYGDEAKGHELAEKLNALQGVETKTMEFVDGQEKKV
jgi:hypothetical protein